MTDDARICPVFRYLDAAAAIRWLARAFGFEPHVEFAGPDGTIAHAELRMGGDAIGVSSATAPVDGNPWSHVREGLYVSLDGVDAHHDRARAAGADIVMPLRDLEYGSREFSARDPGGHLWGVGTYRMASGQGAPVIAAGLHYDDGPGAVAWLVRAFGFQPVLEVPGPGGTIAHAELRLGASVLMLGSTPREAGSWGDRGQSTSVTVEDPDSAFVRAEAAGATVVQRPHDTPYGARACVVRDPEGFLWGLSDYRPGN